ncbi:MAG: Gfo/Idh/MocA family oxidoreductase [Planctomycetota bacterium]
MAPVSRRMFLKGAASVIALPQVIPASALGAGDRPPASERVTLGHIGVGARGSHIVPWFGPEAQSVACADPFESRREAVAKQIGGKAYADLRELLARDDIDAVIVETTDHWHVPAAVLAAKAGKDVYCEKPFGLCLAWALEARDVIQRYGRVFQYGTQGLSYDGARLCAEMVRSGRIGQLREIHARCGPGQSGGSGKPIPVPEDIDYDLWLGPAPRRPYCGQPMVQGDWIFNYDYSVGWLGGMGSHVLAAAELGFDTHRQGPFQVEATGTVPGEGFRNTVTSWKARIEFSGGVTMIFENAPGHSTRFIGTEGWLEPPPVVYEVGGREGSGLQAEPKSLLTSPLSPDDVHLGRAHGGHGADFIRAVKDRKPTTVGIDIAVRSDAILHLTDVAIRTGRKITWDPVKEEIVGDEAASRLLNRPLREPWRL